MRRSLTPTFLRFGLVGILGSVVNIGSTAALVHFGVYVSLSTALGTAISVVHNFFWHRHWTFDEAKSGQAGRQLVRYIQSASVSWAVVWGMTEALRAILPEVPLRLQLAQMGAIGVGFGLNFVLSRFYAFSTAKRVRR